MLPLKSAEDSVPGHFGELLQGCLGAGGPVALITLPCAVLSVRAGFRPAPGFRLHSPERLLSPAELRTFLARISVPARGLFTLRADMPPGGGAGASTAARVAIARLVRPELSPEALARACLASEGASDPLMFPAPEQLLWAPRRAEAIAALPPLPRFDVLGGFHGPALRTRPEDCRFADISDLIPLWREAAARGDLPALARLASLSAERNGALRGPAEDPSERLARGLGALGHVAAHTGAARGLIFAPGTIPYDAERALRTAGFRRITRFQAGGRA